MKQIKRVILLAVPLSFLIGLWWGRLQYEKKRDSHQTHYDLRVLSQKNSLPITLVEAFEKQTGLKVDVIEAEDLASLEKLAKMPLLDVIVHKSYNTKNLIQNKLLVNIQTEKLVSSKNIQVDFWPSEKYDWLKAIPYSWGVNGFLGKKGRDFENDYLETFSDSKLTGKEDHSVFYFSTDFDALYFVLLQNNKELKAFINNNKVDLLQSELSKLKTKVRFFNDQNDKLDKGDLAYHHISNGKAAKYIQDDGEYDFFVPDQGGLFWMNFISLTRQGDLNINSYKFMDFLIDAKTQKNLVIKSDLASVLPLSDSPMLSANYIRQIHLSKLLLFDEFEDPKLAWQSSIKLSFTDLLDKSIKK
ncbi:MAG: extracellular solute-binding protein [Bdellovibrionaceae bacterium]|nr:extracellular solute-binding protein [Pseudobdellovibrionaceae bacterium]